MNIVTFIRFMGSSYKYFKRRKKTLIYVIKKSFKEEYKAVKKPIKAVKSQKDRGYSNYIKQDLVTLPSYVNFYKEFNKILKVLINYNLITVNGGISLLNSQIFNNYNKFRLQLSPEYKLEISCSRYFESGIDYAHFLVLTNYNAVVERYTVIIGDRLGNFIEKEIEIIIKHINEYYKTKFNSEDNNFIINDPSISGM